MTLDEALRELGLGSGATAEQARRAYLRLLRTRNPERDQEGFLRLREAYERSKDDLLWREASATFAGAPEERGPPAEGAAEGAATAGPPERDADAQELPQRAETPDGEHPQRAGDESASRRHDLAARVTATRDGAPAATRDGVPTAARDGAPTGARDGGPTGDTPLDDVVEPAPAPPPAHDALPSISDVERAVAQGKLVLAARKLQAIYEAAAARPDVPTPSVLTAFDLLLRLHETRALKSADRLRIAFQGWLAAGGAEAHVLQDHAAAIWNVVRELSLLPETLSSPVRAAIARAARNGNLDEARRPLAEFAMASPADAASDAALLRQRAPVIAAAIVDALDRGARYAPRVARQAPASRWLPFATIPIALVGVLRIISQLGTHSETPRVVAPPAPHAAPAHLARARTQAMLVGTQALFERDPTTERAARKVQAALDADDCAAAFAAMPELRAAASAGDGGKLSAFTDALGLAMANECRASGARAE